MFFKDYMITIVSGLPRSGTSLMMQMLVAGGMTALSDGERRADIDNPKGYLSGNSSSNSPKIPLSSRRPKAKLSKQFPNFCFHCRSLTNINSLFNATHGYAEVMKSQEEMLKRRGTADPGVDPAAITQRFN